MYMVYADHVWADLETHVDRIFEPIFFRKLENCEAYALEYIEEFLAEKKVKRSNRKWLVSDKMPGTKYIRIDLGVEEVLFVYVTKVVLDETDIESTVRDFLESKETLEQYAKIAFEQSCRNLQKEQKRRWWNEDFLGFEIKDDKIHLNFEAEMHINHRGDTARQVHTIVSSLESFMQFIDSLNEKQK